MGCEIGLLCHLSEEVDAFCCCHRFCVNFFFLELYACHSDFRYDFVEGLNVGVDVSLFVIFEKNEFIGEYDSVGGLKICIGVFEMFP